MMIIKKTTKKTAFCIAAGILAGFINGFLGAGGGIILLWAMKKLNGGTDKETLKNNFASVVAVVLLISTVSSVCYSAKGSVDSAALTYLVIPGMVGGLFGAYLTDRLEPAVLKLIFSVIIMVAGFNMIF